LIDVTEYPLKSRDVMIFLLGRTCYRGISIKGQFNTQDDLFAGLGTSG
jgi:hypothetical protein